MIYRKLYVRGIAHAPADPLFCPQVFNLLVLNQLQL